MGIGASIAAISHGASVVEKHFTLARSDGGVDSVFSLEPDELKSLVIESERAWQALGAVVYGASKSEEKSRIFRRSLYIAEDMNTGDIFTDRNLRIVRPGMGLEPKYYDKFIGRKISKNAKKGDRVDWSLLK
jgi:N-acetylneuraminate synthase